jgi:circadian clock protein KaiC
MVTFDESPASLCANMRGFGWEIQRWIDEGKWTFVDASHDVGEDVIVAGTYDFGALLARIENAVVRLGATRIAIDAIGAVTARFPRAELVRHELSRIAAAMRGMGVTAIITAERTQEHGSISRYGVEEFVADNVVVLRNVLEEGKRRRTVEVLKFRGASHQKGEFPFTVIPGKGIVVIPLSANELTQKSSDRRITSGNSELDRMCGSGFFQDSIVLVSGATGTGKTLLATTFMAGGAAAEEPSLLFAFEESRDQLFRNADGWGFNFRGLEEAGRFKVVCEYPESAGLEDHLINMKKAMDDFRPKRVVVDSLSALERISTEKGYREFVIGLTSFIKERQIAGLFTSTSPSLLGGTSITETHISTITDSIILLRYVELFGDMRRGLTVLKMRGSGHDKQIREFHIDANGMHIGKPFRDVTGILSGQFSYANAAEIERLTAMFGET